MIAASAAAESSAMTPSSNTTCQRRPTTSAQWPGAQMRPQDGCEGFDLGVALQRHAQKAAAAFDGQVLVGNAGRLQRGLEAVGHRAFPHHALRAAVGPVDHGHNGQAELQRKGEVALVVGGHAMIAPVP
jgi:hypothetical protein